MNYDDQRGWYERLWAFIKGIAPFFGKVIVVIKAAVWLITEIAAIIRAILQ